MKQKIFIILACATGLTAASCNQLNNSIRETFHPDSSRVAKTKPQAKDGYHLEYADTVTHSQTWNVQIKQSNGDTISVSFQTGNGINILENAAALSAAEQALRSLPAFAGKTVYLCQTVHFFKDGRIIARVQNPENETYVDDYTWMNGQWQQPRPVQLSVRDNIKTKLISLDAVDFSSVAGIYKNYNQKAAGIEGAPEISHVYMSIMNNDLEWYPQNISGSRELYHISFKRDGSLDRFYRK